ncbi:6-phosphogluconolactonase [Corynebacterium pseudotuberculosis]|uniref:6-phosphogluconolactonase n=1 Tax=Corynebacterium pseudotuberculosis TaxID=1719 RepID=UPI0009738710|nr:6-phosphogluconolactonase [Corynebacterium pseudotuberculosis]APZ31827.1 6-phosphogluconolactonase [Corynebacterium pseudotuberculosis]
MVTVCPVSDLDAVASTAAEKIVTLCQSVRETGGITGDGTARIVLTGGGAGIRTLEKLVDAPIDWSRVHVFLGDERHVPVTDPESNEGQARQALLDRIDIPEENIHGYRLGELSPVDSAKEYTQVINTYAPQGFDLHLLGMGGEGHINSIFPHTEVAAEQTRLVMQVTDSPKPPAERVTLTFPAITRAQRVWLLVAGAEKAEAAYHVAAGSNPLDWPAAGAQGEQETLLIVAQDAAP